MKCSLFVASGEELVDEANTGARRPPERTWQVSDSFRGVVMRLCPGRRLSSSTWCQKGWSGELSS